MTTLVKRLILKDSNGINWNVSTFHDGDIKQLYTRQVDEEGVSSTVIKTFNGYYKIKVGTNGQIYTYPLDDLG